jgi:hypothetical protein
MKKSTNGIYGMDNCKVHHDITGNPTGVLKVTSSSKKFFKIKEIDHTLPLWSQ